MHTAVKIDPQYNQAVVYVKDASRAVGVAQNLVSPEQHESYIAGLKADYAKKREQHKGRRPREAALSLAEARRVIAIMEAADAGIELIACITEGVPVLDMVVAKGYLVGRNCRLLGPNCPGVITPGKCKIGIMPGYIHKPGPVASSAAAGELWTL
jgi:hypothetical protein